MSNERLTAVRLVLFSLAVAAGVIAIPNLANAKSPGPADYCQAVGCRGGGNYCRSDNGGNVCYKSAY